MNCAYHGQNSAVVQCNGCGKPLCPACDHRIKGFPYCQDCIVQGVDLLRQQNRTSYAPFIKKRTSPIIAALLSAIIPGLGAAYNGQTVKALVYFGISAGLLQLSLLTGTPLFFLASVGMWAFALLDAWRTAQMIRSGLTPDIAEDIFVRRFSGNPKLWGAVLTVLGAAFLLQRVFELRGLMRVLLPLSLIALGIYVLRGYVFKQPEQENKWPDFDSARPARIFPGPQTDLRYRDADYGAQADYPRGQAGGWRNR